MGCSSSKPATVPQAVRVDVDTIVFYCIIIVAPHRIFLPFTTSSSFSLFFQTLLNAINQWITLHIHRHHRPRSHRRQAVTRSPTQQHRRQSGNHHPPLPPPPPVVVKYSMWHINGVKRQVPISVTIGDGVC